MPYTVVIADDEPLLLRELRMTIPWEKYGFSQPIEATNGLQAREAVMCSRPDVLITDIRMPGMDGLQLISEIRAFSSARCVIISGYNEFDYALWALKLNVVDYLTKPIEKEALEECLSAIKSQLDEVAGADADPEHDAPLPEFPPAPKNAYLQSAVAYIDANFRRDLTLKELAAALFISESYISKLFVSQFGIRFTEYLNCVRVQKAIELLRETDEKIGAISGDVGYNDYRYFCTVFKKMFGISPAQYRHLYGGAQGQGIVTSH